MLTSSQMLLLVAMVALGSAITRFLPFVLFPDDKPTPPYVLYLGTVLPYAVIGLLVVYCFKGVSLSAAPYGLPEAVAVGAIFLLHLWKKNTLLSIAGGTAVYMLLLQTVFA